VGQWKRAIQEQAQSLFEGKKRGPQPAVEKQEPEKLFSEIGKLKMELNWLKKVRDQPTMKRRAWIDREGELPVVRQCEMAGVTRSVAYAPVPMAPVSEEELLQCRPIDEEYTRRPFFGSRRMVLFLKA
jgi:hypothetical protein